MAIPAVRIIAPTVERNFGRFGDASPVPPLTDIQTRSYDRFLQLDVGHDKRTVSGLEGVLREIFPIESYDKKISWTTSSTSWASPGTTRTSAASCASPTAARSASGCGCGRATARPSRRKSTSATCRS